MEYMCHLQCKEVVSSWTVTCLGDCLKKLRQLPQTHGFLLLLVRACSSTCVFPRDSGKVLALKLEPCWASSLQVWV